MSRTRWGHYKKRHILQGMVLQVGYTGMLFFVMSLVLQERGLFDAFFMREMSTYAGLVFFGLLFTPVDMLLSLLLNAVSRRNEFQADAFAAGTTGSGGALIAALKKLSADSLTNLTPHPDARFSALLAPAGAAADRRAAAGGPSAGRAHGSRAVGSTREIRAPPRCPVRSRKPPAKGRRPTSAWSASARVPAALRRAGLHR